MAVVGVGPCWCGKSGISMWYVRIFYGKFEKGEGEGEGEGGEEEEGCGFNDIAACEGEGVKGRGRWEEEEKLGMVKDV